MASIRRSRQLFAELAEKYGRSVAEAFFRAIETIRSGVELQRLTALIDQGNIEEALEALHIDPEAFNEVADRAREAHAEAGRVAAEGMPKRRPDGTALVVRFDGRNPEAEAWLSRQSSDLLTRITTEQRDIVRAKLTEGMAKGANPRQTALEIVGRRSRATGKRVGGVLGLTLQQAEFVRRAREQLASGDPDQLRAYLERGRIDRRFNRTVQKAIRERAPIPAETQARMITAYETQLLRLRGETIGRVETMTSIQKAAFQAYEQAIASGKLNEAAVTKRWSSSKDFRVRHPHAVLDGQKIGFREAFQSITGARMMHPMDTSINAEAQDIIGCRCIASYSVDWLAGIK